jgi:hypothetical protein
MVEIMANAEINVEGHKWFVAGRKTTTEVINHNKAQDNHSTRNNQQG